MRIKLKDYNAENTRDYTVTELVFHPSNLLFFESSNESVFMSEENMIVVILHFSAMGMATQKLYLRFNTESDRESFISYLENINNTEKNF